MSFYLNGYRWQVVIADPYDAELVDRTGNLRLATTDPVKRVIFLSSVLEGEKLRTVVRHELGHATMISYGLLDQLHTMTEPRYWIEMEEWICNFLADYGPNLLELANEIV